VPGLCEVSDGDHRIDGLPLFDGPGTPAAGISGAAGPLGSDAAIGVTLFGPTLAHPGSRALAATRRDGHHRAIVAIAAGEDVLPGLAVQNAEAFGAPYGPPVLQVPTAAAPWLLTAGEGGAELTVQAELGEEATEACNVGCRIEGSVSTLAPLVVMTPKSAWWRCTAERVGGICVWLELIRHFASRSPERTVIFTANTGHELGHVGLDHFLTQHPELLSTAHAWIHLGANFASRSPSVRYQASSETLMASGLAALRRAGITGIDVTPVGERPLGEARNVHDGGGSYVSILGANPWFHQPADRWPDSVDLIRLGAVRNAFVELADALAGS